MLKAPERLRGRMARWTPEGLRQERHEWVKARLREGHTATAVGAALGISQSQMSRISRGIGLERIPKWWRGKAGRIGISYGSMVRVIEDMDPEAREALLDDMIGKKYSDFSKFLIDHWLRTR